ncbi:Iron-regulated protein A precursor [Falsiruegeria litorea R37]|uniref:Iron-regulated protein A n=1 Tax=Falsiruegeria litorea R37 TaxID=1200284 RepID=A0A1Y5RDM5_9RHOB|nr:imelysin family protein [Falsiruegeria litorea]SLN12455.1 Iron-regulated protein A precursor [Falsiruegeria litorea R37]
MIRALALSFAMILPISATADQVDAILDRHVLPGFTDLAESSLVMAQVAQSDCAPSSERLQAAYSSSFDAWIAVSHLRFGPTEIENRGFALAFWPDSRNSTPKTLGALIKDQDPIVSDPEAFQSVSIAGRGFFALEYLLFDERLSTLGNETYRCSLVQAITQDIAVVSQAVNRDWQDRYDALMRTPTQGGIYQTRAEALQEFYKALDTGLQINADLRLGRPLGTFAKPRPKRAEAWRSGRSLRHVRLSLEQLRVLAWLLTAGNAELAQELDTKFGTALTRISALVDPDFSSVATPAGRIRVEALQQAINDIRTEVTQSLGPALGVSAGFNSLDGD